MAAYLKIENPGIAPSEAFTILGMSTKRGSNNQIGKFGSGNKHSVATLLRNKLAPIVFAGNLKMEFSTRPQTVNDGLKDNNFERVVVKYGGKDSEGKSRTSTEDLGFVLEYGATDWLSIDLALREFVSNAIDRAVSEGEKAYSTKCYNELGIFTQDKVTDEATDKVVSLLETYQKTARDFNNVVIEIVDERQVRAKSDTTRVFIPLNEDVTKFYNNLGKWFLHFSEPELINQTILPKSNRNIGERKSAVIYRRGVRVREFESSDVPSLFDYNLENLELDESRKVDDWRVKFAAAVAFSRADTKVIGRVWQSFMESGVYWEHGFESYGLEYGLSDNKKVWVEAFSQIAGNNAVICTKGTNVDMVQRKGFKPVIVPETFSTVGEKYGISTPATVLTSDDRDGREILEVNNEATSAVDFIWDLATKFSMTKGKEKPEVLTFQQLGDAEGTTMGFYRGGKVYINRNIAGNSDTPGKELPSELLNTALEEVAHYVTGSLDNSRDFQNYFMEFIIRMAKA